MQPGPCRAHFRSAFIRILKLFSINYALVLDPVDLCHGIFVGVRLSCVPARVETVQLFQEITVAVFERRWCVVLDFHDADLYDNSALGNSVCTVLQLPIQTIMLLEYRKHIQMRLVEPRRFVQFGNPCIESCIGCLPNHVPSISIVWKRNDCFKYAHFGSNSIRLRYPGMMLLLVSQVKFGTYSLSSAFCCFASSLEMDSPCFCKPF